MLSAGLPRPILAKKNKGSQRLPHSFTRKKHGSRAPLPCHMPVKRRKLKPYIMKRSFIAAILSLTAGFGFGQINFDTAPALSRFAAADSAILAGEFGEVHSLLVVEQGRLVFEKYYGGWHKDSVHQLQSATKSVVATLLGCALQHGFIPDTRTKLSGFFPAGLFDDERKQAIVIEDLLTQRHGLKWSESPWDSPGNTWRKVLETEGDWYRIILETPMDTLPGLLFNYSNAAPVLTAGLIQAASGMTIDSFARQFLFDPLQIERFRFWGGNGGPQNNGMALLFLTPRDMARIGQLYLQQGKWNGRQIIPAEFAERATSPIVKNVEGNGMYESYDYGYFWWSNPVWRQAPEQPSGVFLARGAGGQNIIVWPEKNTVVVITAWNMQQPNKPQVIFEKYISNR